ncbi:MAG: MerR family transcriptional regulator [Chloroflexota bacterium]|nr:MAG: MerR family transcriptional regulator [Chloroflexota bacterium]
MPELTNTYNLKAVIQETGLNPETLRAWERRYGIPKPKRTPGGHRLYSQRDIQQLKWLLARQESGLSISRAVELWRRLEASGQDPLRAGGAASTAASPASTLNEMRQTWIRACLDYDEHEAEQVLAQAFAIASPEIVCIELLQKGLVEIGEQWYQGRASVQQEHFATSLAMRRLHALSAAVPTPFRSGRILAACPPGELHEFGLLLSAYLLRRSGWEVVYLGANVPLYLLEITIQVAHPVLALACAQTLPSAATLQEMAALLSRQNVPLAYGGRIFNHVPALQNQIQGYFLGEDIVKTPLAVDKIVNDPAPLPEPNPLPQQYRQLKASYREKQPLIEAAVNERMKDKNISPVHLDIANQAIGDHLDAALSFGDVGILDYSTGWLQGLLENRSLPEELLEDYMRCFSEAVRIPGR